jgi:Icc-related predicted phosphoesterase
MPVRPPYPAKRQPAAIYSRVPDDTEILLTHTPPYGTRDVSKRGSNVGCRYLAEKVASLKYCRLHVFGHIHEAHGFTITEAKGREGGLVSVNAALAWGGQAIIVDLPNQ